MEKDTGELIEVIAAAYKTYKFNSKEVVQKMFHCRVSNVRSPVKQPVALTPRLSHHTMFFLTFIFVLATDNF